MTKKLIFSIFLLSTQILSQSYLGLNYPVGLPLQVNTGSSRSIGGSGTGIRDNNFGFSLNPANMAMPSHSSFSSVVALNINGFSGTETNYTRNFSPSVLSLVIPAGKRGNLGFSFDKRTDGSLKFRMTDMIEHPELDQVDTVYIGLIRGGGLNVWQGGYGYRFANGLNLGITYERFYFSLSTDQIFGFAGGDGRSVGRIVENSTSRFSADGLKAGVLMPVGKFHVGFSGEYIFTGNGQSKEQVSRFDSSSHTENSFSIHLPPSASLGLSYQINPEWLVAGDLHTTLWNRYESDMSATQRTLRTTYSLSAGASFFPSPDIFTEQYWKNIQYSSGLRYEQMPVAGSSETSFSIGAALPIQESSGMVNLVFEYGRRKDHQYADFSENIFRFQLGINGARKWFERKEYTY